ncbi:60S ribosomal protein L22 [Pseudoloma neurophilia]|uniref:Large ribosomal subunit protein eL22 n=1 Tax=Pseudoloma neurophilia TaxID=146866 RepID=A0A0R0M606_9MICR|nr:60S ribosomal protein L22 [Pseudoloma neurophilia]
MEKTVEPQNEKTKVKNNPVIEKKKPIANDETILKTVILDCTNCTNESLFEISDLQQFLKEKIKINGQINQIGKNVTFEIEGNTLKLSYYKFICKRYIKYLGRKYLRAKKLNTWVRLIAYSREGYKFSFYNIDKEGGAE